MGKYSNRFTMKDVMDFWDGVAHEYIHENEKVSWVHDQRFTEALKRLKLRDGIRLLNIWSRDGGAIPYLRSEPYKIEIYNVELSLNMIKQAKDLFPDELFIQSSLHELPFAERTFDVVLSLETLEHVPDPLLFLKELRRVLIDGGDLVMSLPPSAVEWTSYLNDIFKFHHGEGPHRFLPPSEVKEMLGEAGFSLLEHRGTLFLPFSARFIEKLDNTLSKLFGDGFFAQFGLRQFYVCKASR